MVTRKETICFIAVKLKQYFVFFWGAFLVSSLGFGNLIVFLAHTA